MSSKTGKMVRGIILMIVGILLILGGFIFLKTTGNKMGIPITLGGIVLMGLGGFISSGKYVIKN